MISALKPALDLVITLLTIAIFGRVILSWIFPRGQDPLSRFLFVITEPILQPVRKLLPNFGMLDLSPMIVIFVLYFVKRMIAYL
jgi:YggT family protein